MRIAIYEPDPRVCGPLSWAGHLRSGFEQLGHTVTQVSSTKSGRARKGWGTPAWGGHWWSSQPDLVCRDADLGKVLGTFDLVIMPEPKSPAEDKLAVKQHRWPLYYLALWEAKTPFIAALHGNDYTAANAPFMQYLLELPNFVGKLMSHSARSVASNTFLSLIPHFNAPLPYLPTMAIDAPYPVNRTVGTTGRFMLNKGCHLVALSAMKLHPDTVIELWGSSATGLGTSTTFVTYEALLPDARQYRRYGDQAEKLAAGYAKVTEHGNTIRPYLWDVRMNNGALVRYLGNYTRPVEIASRLGTHVNLTGSKYSGGLVEYSTLEALDAGSVCIVPPHVNNADYAMFEIAMENPPGTIKATLKQPNTVELVANTIASVSDLALAGYPATRRGLVQHNREQLRRISDPTLVAQQLLDEITN